MKLSVLGEAPNSYRKKLYQKTALCITAVLLTVGVHILLLALRTEQNHRLFLFLNIAADILCGIPLFYFVATKLTPKYRLYWLFSRKSVTFSGQVVSVSKTITRYMDMDCYEVTVDGRKLFLPADTIALEENRQYDFSLVSNTIVEVEL